MNSELQTLYVKLIDQVTEIESCIVEHLPTMITASTNKELKKCLSDHFDETEQQYNNMEMIRQRYGTISEMGTSQGSFELLLEEAGMELEQITDPACKDAFILCAASTVEHIEIAKYQTLIEWAKQLNLQADKDIFERICNEEQNAADKLKSIANGNFFSDGLVAEAVEKSA